MKAYAILLATLVAITPRAISASGGTPAPVPAGYRVLADVRLSAGTPRRGFRIVALGRTGVEWDRRSERPASARPLLIFAKRGGRLVQVGRNDHVVLRADEGGQCDPFLDADASIVVKGRFFTVENGVTCGKHWTDFVTFRLDHRRGFVFDNERAESWMLNPSDAPDAEAMVRDGPQHVWRDPPGRMTAFADWRPRR